MVRTQTLAPSLTSVHLLVSLEGNPDVLEQLVTSDPVFRALCEAHGLKIIRATMVPPTEEEMGMNRLFELIGRMETMVQQHQVPTRAVAPSKTNGTARAVQVTQPHPLAENATIRRKLKAFFSRHPEVSQGQFADKTQLGRSTISAFLNGRDLAPFSLEKIARQLKD